MPHAGRLTARLGFAAMKHPFYDLDIPNEGSLHHIENEKDACGVGFVANIEGKRSRAMSLAELQQFSDIITDDVFDVLSLEGSVNARNHIGGTAPNQVVAAITRARLRIGA